MTGNNALPVDHIGPAAPAQVDAADDIIEQVVFIGAHHIKNGLPVLLHRHPHGNAQLILKDGGRAGGQIVRLLQKGKKSAVQRFRRAVDSQRQPPVQVV